MSSAATTILATVISAVISVCVALISYMTAKSASRDAVKSKLDELRQAQITEVLHQRIERYPSLWKLCQGSIAVPDLTGALPAAGWDAEFSSALEEWHAEHGVFLSQDSYRGLWHLRDRARYFARYPTAGEDAVGRLGELNKIWTQGFIEDDGTAFGGIAYLLKNDLGSYGRAALTIQVSRPAPNGGGKLPVRPTTKRPRLPAPWRVFFTILSALTVTLRAEPGAGRPENSRHLNTRSHQ